MTATTVVQILLVTAMSCTGFIIGWFAGILGGARIVGNYESKGVHAVAIGLGIAMYYTAMNLCLLVF